MAVDYLSAINRQGSGLNITELVDGLVDAETAPQVDRIQKDIDNRNAAISGYAMVANELGKLQTFTDSLSGSSAFSVNSNSSSVEVKVNNQAEAKAFNAQISISSLAQAQTLEFSGFSSKTDAINLGSIAIDFGSWSGDNFTINSAKTSQTVTVSSANNTLNGLAESLAAIEGVNATVTDKGDGTFSLIVNSDTGAKNSLRLSVTEDASDMGLAAFDTTSNNASKQVVAAQDATINLNGVSITRESNVVTDLIDGYEFKLNATTSSAASVSSITDQAVAFSKISEFVNTYNSVSSTIGALTQNGVNGQEKGVLARDITVKSIQRNLRSILTSELPGYGERGRYLSELGVKTMRDGTISVNESDFNKAFEKEPILFDVIVNSMATSDNALVSASQTSTVLIPKAGSYNFVSNNDGTATLGGTALSASTLADGTNQYISTTGDTKGLRLTVSGNVSTATVFYGQSLADKLSSFIEDMVSATGDLEKSKSRASSLISEYNEDKANLDTKVESIRERYMQQFSAMEAAVSGFNKTGEFLTGFIDSMKPKD